MANIILVSAGTLPSAPVPRESAEKINSAISYKFKQILVYHSQLTQSEVFFGFFKPSFLNDSGTSIVSGLIKVKNKTFAPDC